MMETIFENNEYKQEVGPLLWYQRPLVKAMYLWLAFFFVSFLMYTIFSAKFVEKEFRQSNHRPDEIEYSTIEKSTTSNDRLVAVNSLLRQLDKIARDNYGELHRWHSPQTEPPNTMVALFVHALNDPSLDYLHKYNHIAQARLDIGELSDELESKIDGSVSQFGFGATADYRFRAERILKIELANVIEDLQRHIENLKKLTAHFQQRRKEFSL